MRKAMKSKITMYEKNPAGFEVREYGSTEKEQLIAYMHSVEPFAAAGLITDCVTGERLKEEDVGYTDGDYMWTSQDIYHIEKYDAAITDDFYKKVIG